MNLNFWKKDTVGESQNSEYQNSDNYQESNVQEHSSEVTQSAEVYEAEPADPEKAKFYNNISRWALYVGIFLLPLFFLPWTSNVLTTNKQMLLLLVSSIGLISWLLGVVSSGYMAWRNNPLDRGVLAFLGAFVIATAFSIDKFKSLFGVSSSLSNSLISIIALTILYFLVVNNIEDRGKTLRSLIGLSIIVALVYGLLQIFGVYIFRFAFSTSQAFNSVGSINSLGILAAIALPMLSKNRIELKRLSNLHLEKIGVIVALFTLVLLNWWVLWTVAISGMVGMIIFEHMAGSRFKMRKLLLPMTVVVLGVFLMIVNLDLSALKRNLPVEVAPSFELSTDIVTATLKEKPIYGYGLENFSIAFDKYGTPRISSTNLSSAKFFDANSEVVTLITQGGFVMVGALAFLLWSVGLALWKFRKYAMESSDRDSVRADTGVLAAIVALLVAMFLYPFNTTLMALLFIFMGLVALIVYGDNRKEFNIEEKTSLSLASSLGFIGGLIIVLVGVYFGSTLYIGDVKYEKALKEPDRDTATALFVEAINWNGNDDRYYRSASQVALNLLSNDLNKPVDPDTNSRIQNYISTAISLARRATEISPQEATNWANLGLVYHNLISLVDGVDKLAEEAYLKASELRPGDPNYHHRIGMVYLSKVNFIGQLLNARRINLATANEQADEALAKAEVGFKRAIELSPNFGLAIYNLGIVYDRQGKLNESITQLEKIAPFNSKQPGLAFELGLLYLRAGRSEDAIRELERAVVLANQYSNARWYLALLYEERGDIDAAIAQLEAILSVDVNRGNDTVLTKLDELQSGQISIPPGEVLDQEPLR